MVARNRIFAVLILLVTGIGFPANAALPAASGDALADRHARAIELAREGSLAESLQLLSTLRAEYPGGKAEGSLHDREQTRERPPAIVLDLGLPHL